MVTIGTVGTCQRCGQMGMESEIRWNEERAECPHCGLYYEVGPLSQVIVRYLPEPEHTPYLAPLYNALRANGWYSTGEVAFRVGVINRPPAAAPCFYVINSWFMLPTPLLEWVTPDADADEGVPTDDIRNIVRWITFDDGPAPTFDRDQWYVEDTYDYY